MRSIVICDHGTFFSLRTYDRKRNQCVQRNLYVSNTLRIQQYHKTTLLTTYPRVRMSIIRFQQRPTFTELSRILGDAVGDFPTHEFNVRRSGSLIALRSRAAPAVVSRCRCPLIALSYHTRIYNQVDAVDERHRAIVVPTNKNNSYVLVIL